MTAADSRFLNERRAFAAAVLIVAAALGTAMAEARAAEARVAVATNFTSAAREVRDLFQSNGVHRVAYSFGSTGQLYAQITQGAPFDVLLAADRARPARAVAEGYAVAGSRFTYATGRIVLYSIDAALVNGPETLRHAAFDKIAIANPVIAPYGAAAVEAMRVLGVLDALRPKFVQGKNIAQTHQFVMTGSAEAGFVALSQVAEQDNGSRWVVPAELHPVLAQDAVLLINGADNEAARAYLAFLRGPDAKAVKDRFGYGSGD